MEPLRCPVRGLASFVHYLIAAGRDSGDRLVSAKSGKRALRSALSCSGWNGLTLQRTCMDRAKERGFALAFWMMLAMCCWRAPAAGPSVEQKFDELQIGTHTYRNVTVTTKNTNYVFLLHSEGMSNFKVSELPSEVREKLGYEDPKPVIKTNVAAIWAKEALSKLDEPRLRGLQDKAATAWHDGTAALLERMPTLTPKVIALAAGTALILHLCWSFCVALICLKVDKPGGIMAWLPILQAFPLFRAAGMSGWWFLASFVPVLNLVAGILWCVKICNARGKNGILAFFLILPGINILAFLYLAFSNGETPKKSAGPMKLAQAQGA